MEPVHRKSIDPGIATRGCCVARHRNGHEERRAKYEVLGLLTRAEEVGFIGAIVDGTVRDPEGREVARGISAYASDEIRSILGCSSDRIEERLGFRGPDELIHRNDQNTIPPKRPNLGHCGLT